MNRITDTERKGVSEESRDRDMQKMEYMIERGIPVPVSLEGKIFKIRQISNKLRIKIHLLTLEAELLSEQAKKPMSVRKAKRIHSRIYSLHAKTAAYYILGNRALFVPFLYAWTWRRLRLLNDTSLYTINHIGANNEGFAAFSAGWHLSKNLLSLSMDMLGNAHKQRDEREMSAERMVREDLKKGQDSK